MLSSVQAMGAMAPLPDWSSAWAYALSGSMPSKVHHAEAEPRRGSGSIEHVDSPATQLKRQDPRMQRSPDAQRTPQPPQFSESSSVFAQYAGDAADGQVACDAGHARVHVPLEQTRPVAHRLPHAPQLFGSFRVSAQ